jgi:hypothetical protein
MFCRNSALSSVAAWTAGDNPDREMPCRHASNQLSLLSERVKRRQDLPRPLNHPLAFQCDSLKGAVALYDRDAELSLQLLDRVRQGRLRDMATVRGAAEVSVLVQRDEIGKLAHKHRYSLSRVEGRTCGYNETIQ